MINSVSSMSNAVSMMRSSGAQRQPPPPGQDVFKLSDTDSNGVVSGTELETLVKGIQEVTGNTINENTLASFDADGDGGLNGEELLGLMQSNGFSGPAMVNSENGETSMRPPPPPPTEQALSSYAQNSGDDMLAQLLEMLQNGTDNESALTSIDVTS